MIRVKIDLEAFGNRGSKLPLAELEIVNTTFVDNGESVYRYRVIQDKKEDIIGRISHNRELGVSHLVERCLNHAFQFPEKKKLQEAEKILGEYLNEFPEHEQADIRIWQVHQTLQQLTMERKNVD